MNGELYYVQNARHRKVIWILFYLFLISVFIGILFWVASHIRSHSLPVGQIQLSVSNSKYLVGEPVLFTLTNKLNTPVYVTNRCPTEPLDVYRKEAGKWVRLHASADLSECPDESRSVTVPANGSITSSFAPWQQMFDTPGNYRVVAVVENYAGLTYQDFEVVEPKKTPQTQQQNTDSSSDSAQTQSQTQSQPQSSEQEPVQTNDRNEPNDN